MRYYQIHKFFFHEYVLLAIVCVDPVLNMYCANISSLLITDISRDFLKSFLNGSNYFTISIPILEENLLQVLIVTEF